ncbi:MAG: hypothetical protein ONB49_14280, partial [candidate division KSB1 bacterium]|nr:hypothetical protein [candidate division KSB1 bacterium]
VSFVDDDQVSRRQLAPPYKGLNARDLDARGEVAALVLRHDHARRNARARQLVDRLIDELAPVHDEEDAFAALDAPVCVLGSLDTPVPYSPPLEEAFLVSQKQIEEAARQLARY